MALKLITFNCRGMQDFFKRKKTFLYLKSLGSDICFLQETHLDQKDEILCRNQWGESAFFSSFSSNSRGVGILIRNTVSFKVLSLFSDPEGRFLILKGVFNDLNMTLVNVYAPNQDDPDFLLRVFTEIDKINSPFLIVGGDFNSVLGPLDYQGSRLHHSNKKNRELLSIIIEEYGLVDVWRHFHPNLRQYTRHQKTPRVLSRLDFFLISTNFLDNCVSSKILPGVQSDHSIVQIAFNDNQPKRGKGFWKMNCHYLLNDSDSVDHVKEIIKEFKDNHKNSGCNPNIIWDALKACITGVCIGYFSRKKKERNREKNELLLNIDKIRTKLSITDDADLLTQLEEFEEKLNKIYDYETKGSIIRSRVRWFEEGEKSSKYFCNLENRSFNKKNICRLQDSRGNFITDPAGILEEIHSFYDNLYSFQDDAQGDLDETVVNETLFEKLTIPQLSEEQKESLDQPLTKHEISEVIKSMNKNKTPGFDGLPVEFYIVFWPDICDMLISSFNFSIQNGMLSPSQRNGIITLLPKKDKNPLFVKNYRPITLLTTDYKILAKCFANRLKRCLNDLIHTDQTGFMKGRNIGHNVRLILDIIQYTEVNNIPGSILLIDIQKAFDSVSHQFLFQTLKQFNFGQTFIDSIKTLYSSRFSYVMNNGFLSGSISMKRGIFQGCPISPYLFLLVIEIMALSIRQNPQIKGIPLQNQEIKVSLFADDSVCFLDGSDNSFFQLFECLSNFGKFSGCKINFSKTEAVWIGSKRGCQLFPYSNSGVSWKESQFKCLGINFSLNTDKIFDLNYSTKLRKIEQTLNCWKMRNLSLIGKVCVIKTLILPQLIYLFSVLCIKIPMFFFKKLNTLFFKFIWSGGKDRVQRKIMCSDYSQAGLKMIDPHIFAIAQKMTWVKLLLDEDYDAPWKCIELSFLEKFHPDILLLWKSYAPECILKSLGNMQLADSLRSWYYYREEATKEFYDHSFSALSSCQVLWYNRLIRSKSKKYLFFASWYGKSVCTISDLFNPPLPGHKLFEELILDYGISPGDRRRFNFLIKCIPDNLMSNFDVDIVGVHETVVHKLLNSKKVPRDAYKVLFGTHIPEKRYAYWDEVLPIPSSVNWEKIHRTNFFCTIDTKFWSFYFKVFHKAIALNNFLHKIKRKDSPTCSLCGKQDETIVHLFCTCEKVVPLWHDLLTIILQKNNLNLVVTNFEKLFGFCTDRYISYLFLLLKYHIYVCKFNNSTPNFLAFRSFVKKQKEIEYISAKKAHKLTAHFKKWRFEI